MSKYCTSTAPSASQNTCDVDENDSVHPLEPQAMGLGHRVVWNAALLGPHRQLPHWQYVEPVQVYRVRQREYHRRGVAPHSDVGKARERPLMLP